LLLFFFVLLSIPQKSPAYSQAADADGAPVSLALYSSEIADMGESQKAAVLRVFVFSGSPCNLSAFCSPVPIQKNALILSFPSVPGTDPNASYWLSSLLSQSGISSRTIDLKGALSSQDSIIFSSAGAIPLPILGNASSLSEANTRVVVLESLPGKAMDEGGRIFALNQTIPPNFAMVQSAPGSKSGLDEAVRQAVFLGSLPPLRQQGAGNITLVIPINSSYAYCRVVADASGGKYRFADSGRLQAYPGSLQGRPRMAAGESGVFEFALPGNDEVGRTLRFFAVAHSESGAQSSQELAGGKISEGFASRSVLGFSQGGKYVVRIIDQFGRVHAAAFVQVPVLSILPVSSAGNRYEFLAVQDGEPVDGILSARLDNGSARNYSAQSGKLVLWAAPSSGNHTLYFDFRGSQSEYEFFAGPSGLAALLDTYLRFGAPAAIFILAAYFLLRAGRRAKYSITFPKAAVAEPSVAEVSSDEIISAYARADRKFGGHSLPCYPDEIASQLGDVKKGAMISAQSVLMLLCKLTSRGIFAKHEGAFVPVRRMGGFSARELAMLRIIHECMLERGLRFSPKAQICVKKGELEIVLFRGKESVLSGLGRACRAVVFENSDEVRQFGESLSWQDHQDCRIRLAMANDKIILVAASRGAISSLLP
jgi:hypothetical protein